MSAMRVIGQSVRTMSRYKVRTGFMMLGSVVGAAALTLVISAGQAAERKMIKTVGQILGDSGVMVLDGAGRVMPIARGEGARLKIADIEALAKQLPGIVDWDPQQVLSNVSVRRGGASRTARVLGESDRSEQVWGRSASEGEYFDATAVRTSARVALVGETVAKALFQDGDAIGADVQIGSVPFHVIGVLERWGTDPHGMDRDDEVIVPISTLMRRLTNVDTISAAKLVMSDPGRSEEMRQDIRRILRERHGLTPNQADDFTIFTPAQAQEMMAKVRRVLFLYLPLAAGVALVIGGLVAAALMLASVSERTGEIGLRRAVGAGTGDIRLQFLIETVATTLAGGAGGIVAGYIAARMAATRMHLGSVDVWIAAFVCIAASALVGLAAGLAPAMRAARLRPADALR